MAAPEPGGVLALDLGHRSVGWACSPLAERLPAFGVWDLPPEGTEGSSYVALTNRLYRAIDEWRPSHIVTEAPLSLYALFDKDGQQRTDTLTVYRQHGLRAMVHEASTRKGLGSPSGIDAGTVRREVMGRGTFAKGAVKMEVVQFCRRLGLDLTSDHAADAVLVWLWHRARVLGVPPVAGPLFGAVA